MSGIVSISIRFTKKLIIIDRKCGIYASLDKSDKENSTWVCIDGHAHAHAYTCRRVYIWTMAYTHANGHKYVYMCSPPTNSSQDSQGIGEFKYITYKCNVTVGLIFVVKMNVMGCQTEIGKGLYPGYQIILNLVFHCLLVCTCMGFPSHIHKKPE